MTRLGALLSLPIILFASADPAWLGPSQDGMLALRAGRYKEAEALFATAVAIAGRASPDSKTPALLRNNLASAQYLRGDFPSAASTYRDAIAHWHGMQDTESPDHASAHANFAVVLRTQADWSAAEAEGREAVRLFRKLPEPPPQLAAALDNLAEISRLRGRFDESERWIREAEQAFRSSALQPVDIRAKLAMTEGSLWADRQRPEIAEPFYRSAKALHEKVSGARHPQTLAAIGNLAQSLELQGRLDDSEPLLKEVLEGFEASLGPDHHQVAVAANNLAQHYRRQRKYADAEPLYRKALAIWEQSLGSSHPDVAKGLKNLGDLFALQGKVRGAETLYLRSLKITEALDASAPMTRTTLNALSELYRSANRRTDFDRVQRRLGVAAGFTPR